MSTFSNPPLRSWPAASTFSLLLTFALSIPPTSAQFLDPADPSSTDPDDPTATDSADDPQSTTHDDESSGTTVFSYYFLIVVAALVVLGLSMLLMMRHRRRKRAARDLENGTQALATDLAANGQPPGSNGRAAAGLGGYNRRVESAEEGVVRHEEGLDADGEAPPPYMPGGKPPSISNLSIRSVGDCHGSGSQHRSSHVEGTLGVYELQSMNHEVTGLPPHYDEAAGNGSQASVARPAAAHILP